MHATAWCLCHFPELQKQWMSLADSCGVANVTVTQCIEYPFQHVAVLINEIYGPVTWNDRKMAWDPLLIVPSCTVFIQENRRLLLPSDMMHMKGFNTQKQNATENNFACQSYCVVLRCSDDWTMAILQTEQTTNWIITHQHTIITVQSLPKVIHLKTTTVWNGFPWYKINTAWTHEITEDSEALTSAQDMRGRFPSGLSSAFLGGSDKMTLTRLLQILWPWSTWMAWWALSLRAYFTYPKFLPEMQVSSSQKNHKFCTINIWWRSEDKNMQWPVR